MCACRLLKSSLLINACQTFADSELTCNESSISPLSNQQANNYVSPRAQDPYTSTVGMKKKKPVDKDSAAANRRTTRSTSRSKGGRLSTTSRVVSVRNYMKCFTAPFKLVAKSGQLASIRGLDKDSLLSIPQFSRIFKDEVIYLSPLFGVSELTKDNLVDACKSAAIGMIKTLVPDQLVKLTNGDPLKLLTHNVTGTLTSHSLLKNPAHGQSTQTSDTMCIPASKAKCNGFFIDTMGYPSVKLARLKLSPPVKGKDGSKDRRYTDIVVHVHNFLARIWLGEPNSYAKPVRPRQPIVYTLEEARHLCHHKWCLTHLEWGTHVANMAD